MLVIVCLLAGAAPAGAATTPWVGFNDGTWMTKSLPQNTLVSLEANAGATSARLVIDWSWFEASPGQYQWGVIDPMYQALWVRGMRPLITITGAPKWAWDPRTVCLKSACNFPPGRNHYYEYGQMLTKIAARYPQTAAIEVGNEPNLAWAWNPGPDPVRYAELLKVAYNAVKAGNPSIPVITGGLAPVLTQAQDKDSVGVRPFLQTLYDNGARGYMDGIAIHAYPYDVDFDISLRAISIVKETAVANGNKLPVWVTEFGMTTTGNTGFSEYQQATTLPRLYKDLRADPEIAGLYVHSLFDNPQMRTVDERGYGLLYADQRPKPAYCAFATANAAPAACSATAAAATTAQSQRWDAQILLQQAANAARQVHGTRGTYVGLTSADLNAVDPRISAQPAPMTTAPGAQASPNRISVTPPAAGKVDRLLLCNASKADGSYCIWTAWPGLMSYGTAVGTIASAASATTSWQSTKW
ncbi:MAG: polysaccharide biosynthesis protein PslG [Solirubrobacteraceae bacterium]|nr:polysaccharide biosynthesis protein PslG [Solirubrobacteraceae bacterium]